MNADGNRRLAIGCNLAIFGESHQNRPQLAGPYFMINQFLTPFSELCLPAVFQDCIKSVYKLSCTNARMFPARVQQTVSIPLAVPLTFSRKSSLSMTSRTGNALLPWNRPYLASLSKRRLAFPARSKSFAAIPNWRSPPS